MVGALGEPVTGMPIVATVTVIILSDTHGHLDPRIAELARRCDIAVHAGDIMGTEVLQALRPRSGEVCAVRGNNDVAAKWAGDGHDQLSLLPEEYLLPLPGGTLAVEHGHKVWDTRNCHDRLRRKYETARAIAYGHTHRLVCDLRSRPWVLNPGAAGRTRTYGGPACLVLTAGRDRWRVKPYRFDKV